MGRSPGIPSGCVRQLGQPTARARNFCLLTSGSHRSRLRPYEEHEELSIMHRRSWNFVGTPASLAVVGLLCPNAAGWPFEPGPAALPFGIDSKRLQQPGHRAGPLSREAPGRADWSALC